MTISHAAEYKDSGVPWIGTLPSDWEVKPAKALFSNPSEPSLSTDVHLTPSQKYGVLPQVEYMEITGSRVVLNLSGAENMRHVEAGDFVSHLRSFQGGIEYSTYSGKVSNAYTVLRPRIDFNHRFFQYLLKSNMYVQGLQTTTDQLRDGQSIRYGQFALLPLPFPPREQQDATVEFLDRETAQIDELVTKQYQLVELLLERRRGLIGHAVTKGLCNDESLTSSGDALIGSIPNTWLVNRVSRLFTARKGSNAAELTAEHCATISGEYPVYSGQTSNDGVMASIDSYEFDAGTSGVIFTTTVGAKAMTTKLLFGKFSLSQNCMVIQPREKESINVAFASWFFEFLLPLKKAEMSNHMQTSFRMSDLAEYKIVVPPLEVQAGIVEYLNDVTSKIDALISRARSFASILEERRQALISAAVTGKIDVRGK